MTQIFLVRHGQSEGNLFRRVQGQTDVELTADGKAQLPYLTKRFAETPLAAVYTSPLRRAEETAAAIVGGRDIPVFADKRLIEMCFGAWEMRPWGEVNLESPELKRAFLHDPDRWHVPGSEAHAAVQKRMLAAMTDIARANDGKTVAVACHGMAIRAFLARILGVPSERIFEDVPLVNNTSVTLLRFENDTFSVIYVNDTTHLPAPPYTPFRENGKAGGPRCIEINVSGLRTGHTSYPNASALALYHDLGGEILTLGSDAHTPEDASVGIREGAELLRTIGFRYYTVFEQRKPTFLSLE